MKLNMIKPCLLWLVATAIIGWGVVHSVWAEPAPTTLSPKSGEMFIVMPKIVITAKSDDVRAFDLPGSIDILGMDEIGQATVESALDLIRNVPGVSISDYNSGGVPSGFTLRGFGNSSHGNHTAVTIDGIPYNYHMGSADGAVDLNQLIPEDVVGIEVIKGPIDARYANWSRAGIIHFHTRNSGNFIKSKASFGSFGTKKGYVAFGQEYDQLPVRQLASAEYYQTDGYRDNSAYDRQNVYHKLFLEPVPDLELGLVLHAYHANWHTAGYLPEYLWEQNPRMSIQQDDGGWKSMQEAQLHGSYDLSSEARLEFKAWGVAEQYSRWADWGGGQTESHFDHMIWGALAHYSHDLNLVQETLLKLDTGFDHRSFDTRDENYDTVYRHRVAKNSDDRYLLHNTGIYAKGTLNLFQDLRLFAGARYDLFTGKSQDKLSDTTMTMTTYQEPSYSGGAIYTFLQDYSIYANIGTGFQLPNGADKYLEQAADPTGLIHWETGCKLNPLPNLSLRYAYYESKEELIRWVAGEYINEGDIMRKGHEIELTSSPLSGLHLFAALTRDQAVYSKGENKGKQVPSIPEAVVKLGGQVNMPFGMSVRGWFRQIGKFFTSADNQHDYAGFEVIDLQVSQVIAGDWTVAVDINNLLDKQYSEFVGYWSDPDGVPDNQYAGSDGRYVGLTVSYAY